jgi:pyruvate/2-oxoglutarate dehydrogenase complex dihydrolipoamide dehydrogenase (E3) component
VQRHDLIVIGGGAGGMSAVDSALRRGARTLLVQDGPIGGDCTWTGCVPSKALITAAASGADRAGALSEARRAIRAVAETEGADVFRRRGADVVEGRARFLTRRTIEVDGVRHEADRIVVATGARPLLPPVDGLATVAALTSDTLWDVDAFPASMAVMGGGPIGVELAQALARLGVTVTLFEGADRILGREEPETASLVAEALRRAGVDLRLGEFVERVEPHADGTVSVHAPSREPVRADALLVAVGRRPVTDGLALDNAGVRLTSTGHIDTDDKMETSAPGVFAVGDVTGKFPFTHGAYAQGLVAVSNALGPVAYRRFSTRSIPFVTFTDPEVATVGMTEAEAFDRWGSDAQVVELSMGGVDRAMAEGRTEGSVKLIAAPGRVLGHRAGGQLAGATVVAPRAGELIHELSLAMRLRIPLAVLALTPHAYPTWGMAVQQAVSGFFVDLERGTRRPARG